MVKKHYDLIQIKKKDGMCKRLPEDNQYYKGAIEMEKNEGTFIYLNPEEKLIRYMIRNGDLKGKGTYEEMMKKELDDQPCFKQRVRDKYHSTKKILKYLLKETDSELLKRFTRKKN
jgi:hypothetical protein